MKSGSLRGMPAPPIIITDCGTSRSIEIFWPSRCGAAVLDRDQGAMGRQAAEHLIDERARVCGIDVADDADFERVPREHVVHECPEVVGAVMVGTDWSVPRTGRP